MDQFFKLNITGWISCKMRIDIKSFIIFIMLQDVKIVFTKTRTITARGNYVKGMFDSALKWQEKLTDLSKKEKKKVP